jgi:hypothetical protein
VVLLSFSIEIWVVLSKKHRNLRWARFIEDKSAITIGNRRYSLAALIGSQSVQGISSRSSLSQRMSDPNSSTKRSQGDRTDDDGDDEREPKRATDDRVFASQAASAIEEPPPLAESAALPVPLVVKVSVPTEPAEVLPLNAANLYAKSHSLSYDTTAMAVIHLRIACTIAARLPFTHRDNCNTLRSFFVNCSATEMTLFYIHGRVRHAPA